MIIILKKYVWGKIINYTINLNKFTWITTNIIYIILLYHTLTDMHCDYTIIIALWIKIYFIRE